VVRIVLLAMQRIFRYTGAEPPAFCVDDSDAHAKRAEIYARYDSHE
jgi:hypothetical protein